VPPIIGQVAGANPWACVRSRLQRRIASTQAYAYVLRTGRVVYDLVRLRIPLKTLERT
jgi:hypothetical protein